VSTRRYWYAMMALVLVFGISYVFLSRVTSQVGGSPGASATIKTEPRPDSMAPDFSLPVLAPNVRQISLRGYRGNRPVIINFWATWCPPCRAEMPDIEDAYQKYQDRGLVVLAVNQMEQASVVQQFVTKHGLSFPVLLDKESVAADAYHVRFLPTTVFVRKDGTILDVVVGGPMSKSFIEGKIRELLRTSDNSS